LTFDVSKRLSNIRMRLARRSGAFPGLQWNHYALSLAMLLVVVFALAVMQYRWINQVSEAQEASATSRVREKLRVVTDAFDAEITRAVLVFTSPSPLSAPRPDRLEQVWTTWNREAPWPRIVSGISYLESNEDGWKVRSWGASSALDPRSMLPADDLVPQGARGGVLHLQAHGGALFVDGQPCILWPLPTFRAPPELPRFNRLLICYDLSYLTDAFFPHLLATHSAADDRNDFLFHLGPRGPVASGTVMTADQFHYRPDCLMPVARGEALLSVSGVISGSTERSGIQSGAVEVFPGHDVDGKAPPTWMLDAEGACKTAPPADSGLMHVSVRRPPGSLTDLFTRFRQRNLFVSGLVMMALVAGLIAFVVSTERARRLARLQTVIAAGISHELRSPLASLNVAADHLKKGHVENVEQGRRYGEIIDAQSRRLRHVVDQALALTRLSHSNGVRDHHAASVCDIVHVACDGFAAQARDVGIEIQRQVASDIPLASVDPDVLLRCLINLIENAIKYAASGGWIHVSAHRALHAGRPAVAVTVEDRGPGIEEDESMTVFEPFFRGSSACRSRHAGSGLGLAIVKSAVDAYSGGVELERAIPRGCRFRLFFPTVHDVDAVHSTRSEEPPHGVASHTLDRR
jgi:signal transduction histidine kinase